MSVRPGIRLGDRYQLLSPIATGGMCQVWRAEDTTLHRIVAAKILRSEFTGDATFIERFRAEARNTAALSHPNIASIYDYGETVQDGERLAYLIMELVDGEPLVETLVRQRRLPVAKTLDILEQTARGLGAAHRAGTVHRDVKPGNLIIRPDGVVKITDFGIARAANSVALTDQGTVVGTAQYLAPEQAEGKPANPASDVYALAVVGYECLAGVRPFDGDNSVAIALSQIRDTPRPLPPDVPPYVQQLIMSTMAKNPAARYRDGSAFAQAIVQVQSGAAPIPPPINRRPVNSGAPLTNSYPPPHHPAIAVGQPQPMVDQSSNRTRNLLLVGIGLLVIVGIVIAIVLSTSGQDTSGTPASGSPQPSGNSAATKSEVSPSAGKASTQSSASKSDASSKSTGSSSSLGPRQTTGNYVFSIAVEGYIGQQPAVLIEDLDSAKVNHKIVDDGSGTTPGTISAVNPSENILLVTPSRFTSHLRTRHPLECQACERLHKLRVIWRQKG